MSRCQRRQQVKTRFSEESKKQPQDTAPNQLFSFSFGERLVLDGSHELGSGKGLRLSWIWSGMVERTVQRSRRRLSHLVNKGITDMNSSQELAVIQIFGPEDFTT